MVLLIIMLGLIYLGLGILISLGLHRWAKMPRDLMPMMTVIWGIFLVAAPFIGLYNLLNVPKRKRPKLSVIISENEEEFCRKVRKSWVRRK